MPQNNMLPLFKATYPLLAGYQQPGGETVSTTLWAHAVPNKPQWTGAAGSGPPRSAPQQEEQPQQQPQASHAAKTAKK